MKRRVLPVLFAGLALLAGEAYGQINSPGARTLFARNFLYRSDWRIIDRSRLMRDGNTIENPENRRARVTVWQNMLAYGLPRYFTAMGILPVVTRSTSLTLETDERSARDTGLADPTFLVQYDGLYRKNRPGGFTRLAGFFGVKAPWGQEPFTSNATDFVQGLIFTHSTLRWSFNGDFEWTATTEAERLKVGNVLQMDASVMYHLLSYPDKKDLFLVLEVNAFMESQGERDGDVLVDTGGDTVFLSPGVEFFLRRNLVLELSAQIPVHQRLNGTQLGRDWIVLAGFRFLH